MIRKDEKSNESNNLIAKAERGESLTNCLMSWANTHKIEIVDRLFMTGLWIALIGTGLLFGSGEGIWAVGSFVGVVIILIAKVLVGWADKN